jgi:hypothetical protein
VTPPQEGARLARYGQRRIVSAKALQEANLASLFDLFAVVVSGADDLPG